MADNYVAFQFEQHRVRIFDRSGEKWFVLSDICVVLELTNPSMVAARLDDDEKDELRIADTIGRSQPTLVVSQPGLFKLIQTSRVPKAREFDRWVRHEVLSEIDRTGSYRGTYDGAVIYQQISQLVAPMQADIRELKCDVSFIKSDIVEMKGNVGLLVKSKRNEFSETKVLRPVRLFVAERYAGKCVNGCETQIVDARGNPLECFAGDHWSGPQSSAIGNCFPVCRPCNQKLKDPAARARATPRFQVFQEDLHRWLPSYRERMKHQPAEALPLFEFAIDQPGYADTSSLTVNIRDGFAP